MEQIKVFLTEYSGWIFMAWCGLMMILLAVTLHRIKRVEKQIRKTAEEVQKQTEDKLLDMVQQVKSAAEANLANAAMGAEDKLQICDEQMQQDTPETLLNAVLGEVFP